MPSYFACFAVSPPGLEPIVFQELLSLGLTPKRQQGGVSFQGTLEDLYRANLWLRTASRILIRIGTFKALSFKELVTRSARYPWEIYLAEAQEIRLRVTCRRSKLYHSKAVAERILKGIESRLGKALEISSAESAPLLIVRLFKDTVLLRIDSSGQDLFKRGYKVAPGPAPIRENLAAALIYLSGWDKGAPLVDPFCGTGTIPIEAAMISANIAPGLRRSFAFQRWKNFDPSLWEELREKAKQQIKPPSSKIWANDRAREAIQAAHLNAQAAGVKDLIHFSQKDISLFFPPSSQGFVVTNPPYGRRLSTDIRGKFASFLRRWLPFWKIVFVSPHRTPLKGFKAEILASFDHGGRRVYAFKAALP